MLIMNRLMNNLTNNIDHLSLYNFPYITPVYQSNTCKFHRSNKSLLVREKTIDMSKLSLHVFNKSSFVKDTQEDSSRKVVAVKGTVVLRKKTVLGFENGPFFNNGDDRKISIQLVSAVNADPAHLKGKVSDPAYLKKLSKSPDLADGETAFAVSFDWHEEIAVPGAILVKNEHHSEFYLKTVILQDVPDCGKLQFICNSWIYPANLYEQKYRIFFTNKTYLPHQTPKPLSNYREEELEILRGKGREKAKLEEWDRVYDYAYYNDLGDPDKGSKYVRPIYGGSSKYPYPRRTRTSRPPTAKDSRTESRLSLLKALPEMYVPRDEKFGPLKLSDFLGDTVKSLSLGLTGALDAIFDKTPAEFDDLQDVMNLYEGSINLSDNHFVQKLKEINPSEFLRTLTSTGGAPLLKFPMPDIIKENKTGWSTDEEFARQMLAGVHPIIIRRLEEFPPVSKLDPEIYGNQNSTITEKSIAKNLGGLSVDEAIKSNKLFVLDHHDTVMPYLREINTRTSSKVYATRTILFLKDDGTLKPLAIELSKPHPKGDQFGAISEVYMPASDGVEGSLWQLAKAFVNVTDSGHHQLISHWLNTHAVMEPFVIASNRQLSVLHPIYKLLHPHFKYSISINAVARQIALNAHGLFEAAVYPRENVVEWTSAMYKDWVFTEQALPRDLVKRGMAVKDSKSPHGYKLIIEDYPYAADGLEIWSAIESWVKEYCSYYYKSDDMVVNDTELQSWWKEIREVGHGDLKDAKWWPQLRTLDELTETCTTIIWIASALHAVLNFGQYPYSGYMPNRPTISRQFMPEPESPEYEQLKTNPDLVFLKTVPNQLQTVVAISVIELISGHSADEVYLGQREEQNWTTDAPPLEAFNRLASKLSEIEKRIVERNNNQELKNRVGATKLPYTLLYPTSGVGITGKGIPNSISI